MQQTLTIQITLEELEYLIRRVVTEAFREELSKTKSKEKDGPLLSIVQAALLLGVSKVTIWNYRKQGKIKARKIGRRVLFDKKELLDATKHS